MATRRSQFPHRPSHLRRGSMGVQPAVHAAEGASAGRGRAARRLVALVVALAVLAATGAGLLGQMDTGVWRDLRDLARAAMEEGISGRGEVELERPRQEQRRAASPAAGGQGEVVEAGRGWRALIERAISLARTGSDEAAEAAFLNALFEAEKLSPGHPGLTNVLDHVGYFYDQRQRHDEAIPYYLRALQGYRDSVGEKHEHFIGIERRIAYAYRAQGRFPEAIEHLESAIRAARALHGDSYVGVAYGYLETGDIHRMAGDEARALADHRRALEVARATLADDHELVVRLQRSLGQR